MKPESGLEKMKKCLQAQLSQGGRSEVYSELLQLLTKNKQNIIVLYELLSKALVSRSSLKVYNTLETFEFLLFDSIEFASNCPSFGEKIVFKIFDFAVKKNNWKQIKIKNPKWKNNVRYLAQRVLMGLDVMFQQSRYDNIFKNVRIDMECKLDKLLVSQEDLTKYEEIQSVLFVKLEDKSLIEDRNKLRNLHFSFDTASLAKSVQLLEDIFKTNSDLCGEELKNNEVVEALMEKIQNDQKDLQLAIQETSNHSTILEMIGLNEQIEELYNAFISLTTKKRTENFVASNVNKTPSNIFDTLDSLQLIVNADRKESSLKNKNDNNGEFILDNRECKKTVSLKDKPVMKLTKEAVDSLFN